MKYRNIRTGNVINVKSGFAGKEWVPVTAPAPAGRTKQKVAPVQQRAKKKSSQKKKPVEEFDDEEE